MISYTVLCVLFTISPMPHIYPANLIVDDLTFRITWVARYKQRTGPSSADTNGRSESRIGSGVDTSRAVTLLCTCYCIEPGIIYRNCGVGWWKWLWRKQYWSNRCHSRQSPRGTQGKQEIFQGSRCPQRHSNRGPPEYESVTLPVDRHVRCFAGGRYKQHGRCYTEQGMLRIAHGSQKLQARRPSLSGMYIMWRKKYRLVVVWSYGQAYLVEKWGPYDFRPGQLSLWDVLLKLNP
jgi:hypothetical protein